MHTILMKRFGIVTGGLIAAAALILFGSQLPSCATPEQTARLLKFADLGLKVGLAVASNEGVISPGDRIVIGRTVGVLTSQGGEEEKLIQLADIGLDVAVAEGLLNEGDVLLIREKEEVLVVPPTPPEVSIMLDVLASEMAKPPAVPVDLTGSK